MFFVNNYLYTEMLVIDSAQREAEGRFWEKDLDADEFCLKWSQEVEVRVGGV